MDQLRSHRQHDRQFQPYAGTYDASLGSFGANGTLSQNLATTPGAKYTLSFALSNQDTTFSGDLLTLTFGGATVFSSTGILAGPGYNLFSFTETATGLSTALVFTERNDNSVWNLDAVSVTPITISVPEPSSALLFLAAAGTCLGALRVRRRA